MFRKIGVGLLAVLALALGCAAPKPKPRPVEAPPPAASIPPPTVAWRDFPGQGPAETGPQAVTILCVGDMMFGRRVEETRKTLQMADPFIGMRDVLHSGDFALGNLECVLGSEKAFAHWKARDKVLLPSPLSAAHELKDAGFLLVSVGNNHSLDYREEGLASTLGALKDAGLSWIGVWEGGTKPNEPWIVELRGVKVAFLAYSDVSPPIFRAKGAGHPGTIPPMPDILQRDIPYARSKADFVVVLPHWGIEYQGEPTDRQKTLAHLMIDAGADAVVGSHPHVLQPVERYKGKIIVYSLGNFLFDLRRPAAHPGLVLRLRLDKGKLPAVDYAPSWSGDYFPRPPTKAEEAGFPDWLRTAPAASR